MTSREEWTAEDLEQSRVAGWDTAEMWATRYRELWTAVHAENDSIRVDRVLAARWCETKGAVEVYREMREAGRS